MRLGIIAGSGQLPLDVIKGAINQGIFYSIITLDSQANNKDYDEFKNVICLKLGEVGKALDFLQEHQITHLVFAGGVNRPSLASIIPDIEGTKLLAGIVKNKFLGDDNLLKYILNFFEEKGFKIVKPTEFIQKIDAKKGALTDKSPSKSELEDIEVGLHAFEIFSKLDIGQSLIVSEKRIIAVEGAEGTDSLIKRSRDYINANAVLIKCAKLDQDLRVDAPTIGMKTIEMLAQNRIAGIAIDHNVIILKEKETIAKANLMGIYIYIRE